MNRKSNTLATAQNGQKQPDLIRNQQLVPSGMNRMDLAYRMGMSYKGKRNIYEALGYPDDKDLTFDWYWNRYQRQDIASAVIDRPVDRTWDGTLRLAEDGVQIKNSKLNDAWGELMRKFKFKKYLSASDKLAGIGRFSLLLFGFDDIKKQEDYKRPVSPDQKLKLLYVRSISEGSVSIKDWESRPSSPRFGMPLIYLMKASADGNQDNRETSSIEIHHSRVLHITSGSLVSDVYGQPRLKPIVNRLMDLEKLFGGDAEMFWRGARPGYSAISKDDFEMGPAEEAALHEELDKYEHDLRRFITGQGFDLKALESQISDPASHVDVQMQAISSQTSIPKRILIGSERGELASGQDRVQWLTLIKTRMEEYAEPEILRPFIDKCMVHGILPKYEKYNVLWEDLFSPSELEKVTLGKERAAALKIYSDSPYSADFIPPSLAYKYLLGFTDEESEEVAQVAEEELDEEEKAGKELEAAVEQELAARQKEAAKLTPEGSGLPPTNSPPVRPAHAPVKTKTPK